MSTNQCNAQSRGLHQSANPKWIYYWYNAQRPTRASMSSEGLLYQPPGLVMRAQLRQNSLSRTLYASPALR